MPTFLWIVLFLWTWGLPAGSQAALETRFQEPDPRLLAEIHEVFPEGLEISPTLLDYRIDPNLQLHREAEIEVTFLWEGAGFQNSFGYFLFRDLDQDGRVSESEIQRRELLWENASQQGSGGELQSGETLRLGKFPAGTRMGFYLEADGFRGGQTTYYTLDHLNPDGHRHLAMMASADREAILLGIEDLPWDSSDRDFNDLMFTVSADPKSALEEAIESGNIPIHGAPPDRPRPPAAEAPEKIVGTAESAPDPTAAAPAFLEGSGLGCRLATGAGTAQDDPTWIFQTAGWILLYWKWRRSRP